VVSQELRATAAMIQARWPSRWEGDLAARLEELTLRTEETAMTEETGTFMCGAAGCTEPVVTGGQAQKQAHLRENHPDMYGCLFIPVDAAKTGHTPPRTSDS
jgi:hypothetical protein